MVGDSVCEYCVVLYPSNWEELGVRVWRGLQDEERRVNGGNIWLLSRAFGGEWSGTWRGSNA